MHLLCRLRAVVGAIPRSTVRRDAHRYLATASDCRAAQRRTLDRLLRLNAGSRFSADYGLTAVRTVEDYRARLGIQGYEFFRPWIDRLKRGDHAALLGDQNPLLMFSLSSGTTAESKFIPITRQFYEDYRRGWQIWGIHTLDDHPGVNRRNIVQLSSDYDRFRTPGGTPCGNISGLVCALQKRIVKTMYSVPAAVAKIEDPAARSYATLRITVADDNVGMVMTANPSTLIQLARQADDCRDELIRDIADGTLSRRYEIPAAVRYLLGRPIARRRPARARALEKIIAQTGRLDPRDYWPETQVIAVWTGGSAGAYLQPLRRYYGDLPVRDHGLSASEGRMTIPLATGQADGILDVHTHFFEFIPEDEYESKQPVVLEAHELEQGRNYYVLLTTASGLYRYDICDVVRCVGFYGTTPRLEFLHKGAHISNLTGEKISESQVVAAVRSCTEAAGLHVELFTVSPAWGDPPGYQLLTSECEHLASVGDRLAEQVDRRLQELNCEYRDKRGSGRLVPMRWQPVPAAVWQNFARRRQQTVGGCAEQYKHPCLVPELDFTARLLDEYQPAPPTREQRRIVQPLKRPA